jgi:hypothetical protein
MISDPRNSPFNRARAVSRLLLALIVFLLARFIAERSAHGFADSAAEPLLAQAMLAFMLLLGFAFLGLTQEKQTHPVAEQGFLRRTGWRGEVGLGIAFGWAMALLCLIPVVVFGALVVRFTPTLAAFGWLFVDVLFFSLATLAITVAFQGYPFQCAIRAFGEPAATLLMAILYGLMQISYPGANRASTAFCFAFGLLLGIAYLRTRALWIPWGIHFGWIAAQALLFGLPVSGSTAYSPVIQSDAYAPTFFAGGDYGFNASWFAALVALAAIPMLFRLTRELSFRYNAPVLVPGGIPVDLDAAARRQHESATRDETPAAKPLVQIMPVGASQAAAATNESWPKQTSDAPESHVN